MSAVSRIRQVKTLQQLGFSLAEIATLLDLRVDSPVACGDLARMARDKLAVVEARLAALGGVRDALAEVVDSCCGDVHDERSCARLQPGRPAGGE